MEMKDGCGLETTFSIKDTDLSGSDNIGRKIRHFHLTEG